MDLPSLSHDPPPELAVVAAAGAARPGGGREGLAPGIEVLVRESPLGFGCLALPDLRFVFANAALARMAGLAPDQMLGRRPKEVLQGGLGERTYSVIRRTLREGGEAREIEAEACLGGRADGPGTYVVYYHPVRDEAGRPVAIWIVVQDVTDRRRLEEAYRQQSARLQSVMDTVPAGIVLSDAEGRLVFANREAERIWGQRLIETGISGYGAYGLLNEDGSPTQPGETGLAQVLRGGVERVHTRRLVCRPDGTQVLVHAIASPVRDASGAVAGGLLVMTDITDQRRLEIRQLRLMEIAQAVNRSEPLHSVLRRIRDAVIEGGGFDRAGIWLYDAQAGGMRGSWGTTREGEPVDESGRFFPLSPVGDHPLRRVLRGDVPYHLTTECELDLRPFDEASMAGVKHHGTIGFRAHDRVIGMVFVDNLLTRRPIAESDLQAILPFCEQAAVAVESARLREAEREKADRLEHAVRETHHRVKNNLQVVAALLDLKLMESGATIERADLERLVSQIRAMAAVHEFLSEDKPGLDTRASRVFERLIPMLQSSWGIRCTVETDEAALSLKQGTALALALNELVSNAAKHGARAVEIRFRTVGARCRLEVVDDGPGFPAGFSPETHAHTGLELVKALAQWDLQGRIAIGNRPQGGGCVVLEFPMRDWREWTDQGGGEE